MIHLCTYVCTSKNKEKAKVNPYVETYNSMFRKSPSSLKYTHTYRHIGILTHMGKRTTHLGKKEKWHSKWSRNQAIRKSLKFFPIKESLIIEGVHIVLHTKSTSYYDPSPLSELQRVPLVVFRLENVTAQTKMPTIGKKLPFCSSQ